MGLTCSKEFYLENFDYKQYLINYPDLVTAGISTQQKALDHWQKFGIKENRTYNKRISSFLPNSKDVILFTNARDEYSIKEWCAHHLLLGFDCIYVFDHLSVNPLENVLYNFDFRVNTMRLNTDASKYTTSNNFKSHCIKMAIDISRIVNAKWFLYLDCDEYLVLNSYSNVKDFLNSYPNADTISMNWLMFGSNYQISRQKSIIETYTRSELIVDQHVKTFARPDKISTNLGPHTYDVLDKNRRYSVNKNIKNDDGPFVHTNLEYYNVDAYIAHYVYQSEEDFMLRKAARARDDNSSNMFNKSFLNILHLHHNNHINTSIRDKYLFKINNFLY
jgi:hypothetical protein